MLAELRSISKTYPQNGKSVRALDKIDFQLQPSDFVSIRGPSGCGKTTLLMTLGGLLRPDAGEVVIGNESLYKLDANRRAAHRAASIGFVFQQFHLVPYLSIFDNILAARLGIPLAVSSNDKDRANSLIDKFGLTDRKSHRPGQLSTGERQRVALARALFNSPQILLADEPTGNLDHDNARVVLDELTAFSENGGAVLLVTHDQMAADTAKVSRTMKDGRFE